MARRLLLNGRMGMLHDDSPVVQPLTEDEFCGPGVAHVGYGEYNQRHLLNEWADYLEKPAPVTENIHVGAPNVDGECSSDTAAQCSSEKAEV